MKKTQIILSVGLAFGIIGGSALALNQKMNVKAAKAETETEITVNADFLCYHKAVNAAEWETGFDAAAGSFQGAGAQYWTPNECFSFNSMGDFFRGESGGDGWTGELKSRDWSQVTPYGYFTWSAKDNSAEVYLEFFYDNGAGHSGSIHLQNNAFVENTMMLWYFKIPDFVENSTYTMHVELFDSATAGFGFNNFGYLHVNQTEEQVSDAMRLYLNSLNYYISGNGDWNNTDRNKRTTIFNHYYGNAYLKEVFCRTVSNADEDFSNNADFLKHWTFDWAYDNYDHTAKHFDTIISSFAYRPDDGHNVPFNNGGGYFKGWYADNTANSGFTSTDGAIYRFRSRPFILNNLGLISIKMAGRSASLHVIDVETNSVLGWVDVNGRTFKDSGDMDNIADSDFNTCTLRRYVINLEAYAGRKIQLAIADVFDSGWAASYFDELVTNYSSLADFGFEIDVSTQTRNDNSTYAAYPDYYISSTWVNSTANGFAYDSGNGINTANDNAILNHVDSSAFLGAYNVWKSYFDTVRNGKVGSNYCSILTSDGVISVLNGYNALSADAKKIVCNSDDFERVGSGDWFAINPTIYGSNDTYNIGRSLQYFGQVNSINVSIYNRGVLINGSVYQINNTTMIIVSTSVIVMICLFALFIATKKKKEHN